MDRLAVICGLSGFSFAAFLCLQAWKKWQQQRILMEKLQTISEALEQAEERVLRYQERHDRILDQITLHYFCSRDLEEALTGARDAMNEALEFSAGLRRMQMKIVSAFAEETSNAHLLDQRYGRAQTRTPRP